MAGERRSPSLHDDSYLQPGLLDSLALALRLLALALRLLALVLALYF